MNVRKIGLGLNRLKNYSFTNKFKFPEKLKGGRIEKWGKIILIFID